MLNQVDLRALLVLRVLEEFRRTNNVFISPNRLVNLKRLDQDWKRLGIADEYPFRAGGASQVYRAFDQLCAWGMVDDFTPLRELAGEMNVNMRVAHALVLLADGAVKRDTFRVMFGDPNAGRIRGTLLKLRQEGLATTSPEIQLTEKGMACAKRLRPLRALMAKHVNFGSPYQINEHGRAWARTLTDDWTTWSLPDGVEEHA